MTKEKLIEFSNNIENIISNFEETAWTGNVKLLKDDFNIKKLDSPKHYQSVLNELNELNRQTRLLFVITVLEKVCIEEEKIYKFETPYQASMQYNGILKKEGTFYLIDEDGDYRDIFTSEDFAQFIDGQYWELCE